MRPEITVNIKTLPPGTKTIRVFFAFFLLFSIYTQGNLDPTPLNPVWPNGGFENWFHLPGALTGGFLIDLFGYSSILLPLYFLFFRFHHFSSLPTRIAAPIFTLIILNMITALTLDLLSVNSLTITGGWGFAAILQFTVFPGTFPSIVLLVLGTIYALLHLRPDTWIIQFLMAISLLIIASSKEFLSKYSSSLSGNILVKDKMATSSQSKKENKSFFRNPFKKKTVLDESLVDNTLSHPAMEQIEKPNLFQNALEVFEKDNNRSAQDIDDAESVESIFDDLLSEKDEK